MAVRQCPRGFWCVTAVFHFASPASRAAAAAVAHAAEHMVADAVHDNDVIDAFKQAAAASDRGDAKDAAERYRKATAHAIAATSGTSAAEEEDETTTMTTTTTTTVR